MKRTVDIQSQLASIKKKYNEASHKLEIAEMADNSEEMLILEMQLAEIKGIIKALEWVLK